MTFNLISKIYNFFTNSKSSNSQRAREFMKKKFEKPNSQEANNEFINERKQQSMRDSQGKSDFSGSAYNGPGNVDHEKTNSNMSQRNF